MCLDNLQEVAVEELKGDVISGLEQHLAVETYDESRLFYSENKFHSHI
jgi:hypothetical protein